MTIEDPQEAELEALLPDSLWDAIREARNALLAEATRASAAPSSAHWLYLLRRLSRNLLAGQQPSTWANAQFTAEVLSGMAGASEADGIESDDILQFAVSEDLIPSLLRLLACARLHVSMSASYRWCAKGAALRFPSADAPAGAFVEVVQALSSRTRCGSTMTGTAPNRAPGSRGDQLLEYTFLANWMRPALGSSW